MTKSQFFLGYPVDFKGICYVHPPLVKEVVSNKYFPVYEKALTLSQEEIEDEYVAAGADLSQLLTPFEYLLNSAYNNPQLKSVIQGAFYFFVHESVTFLFEQKQIIIGDISQLKSVQELRVLKEEDYFEFQNLVRMSVGGKPIEPPRANENPRIKAMKAKARYRDKIKAKQGKGINLHTSITSICCMNLGLTPLNIGELSYAAVPMLMNVYQEKEKYDLDIRSLLAGADSKKVKPKYWIRNLED